MMHQDVTPDIICKKCKGTGYITRYDSIYWINGVPTFYTAKCASCAKGLVLEKTQ